MFPNPEISRQKDAPLPDFDPLEIESSLVARFEKQVRKYPHRLAIQTSKYSFTYQALNRAANQIGRMILDRYGSDTEPIALLFEPSGLMIVAILGILKVGKFWVPLDPSYPRTRLAYILKDSQATLLLTDDQNYSLAQSLSQENSHIIKIDGFFSAGTEENISLPISPDTLAYILYTSGSTGRPKGVVQNHRNVLHSIWQHTQSLHITAADRLSMFASYSHLSGLTDILRALLNGATLFPYNLKKEGLVHLAPWLIEQKITLYHSVPTLFRHFVHTLDGTESFPDLRLIHLGGEPLSKQDVLLYQKHFADHCILLNNLGCTEASTFRQFFITKETPIDTNVVPVGYDVEGKDILLLDESGRVIKEGQEGQEGEIVIKSAYLAVGYWQKPELTQKSFLSELSEGHKRVYRTGDLGRFLPNGCLIHLGRRDSQVKIRGNRVEIAEVETILLQFPKIKEGAVIAQEDEFKEKELVAYLVPHQPSDKPSLKELHHFLQPKLPDYMIPSHFLFIEKMPLMPNGKIDRVALSTLEPIQSSVENSYIPPRDVLEAQLITVWEQILGRHPIGIKDNFFRLGGHSLAALRMFAQIEKISGKNLPIATLLRAATIEELATLLRQEEVSTLSLSPLVLLQSEGDKPPFFCLPGNLGNVYTDLGVLARHLGSDQPFYGLQDGMDNPAKIETLATRYLKEIQEIQPEGPYFLGGVCSGGVVAYEMAQQLRAQGQQVAFLALIEPAPPRGIGLHSCFDFFSLLWRRSWEHLFRYSSTLFQMESDHQRVYFHLKLKLIANLWALRCYTPRPYSGQIHLFLTDESLADTNNFRLRWRQFASLKTERIPGTHNTITGNNDTIIQETHIKDLAEKIKSYINEALKRET